MIQERTRIQRVYHLLDESNYPYVGDADRKEFEIDYSGQKMTISRKLVNKSSWDEMGKSKYTYHIVIGDKIFDKYYEGVPHMLKQLKGEKYEDGGELSKKKIKSGTVLISKFIPQISVYLHAGIVSIEGGEAYVYHNDPGNPINEYGGSVERTLLDEYLKKQEVVEFYQSNISSEEIIERVKKVQDKPFDWLNFNCEKFIEVVTERPMQREKAHPIELLSIAAGAALATIMIMKDGGLIAPNGKPSNLTPEQYRLVRTPAFKKWFGDWENDPENASKVVDENGEPMVVYHGSRSEVKFAFSEFNVPQEGVYFSSDYKTATWFSDGFDYKLQFEEIELPSNINENSTLKDLEKYYKENIDTTAYVSLYNFDDGSVMYRLEAYNETSSTPLGKNLQDAQKRLYKEINYRLDDINNGMKRPFYRVFLNIRSPYKIDAKGKSFYETPFEDGNYSAVSVTSTIKSRGKNDGVIIENTIETTEINRKSNSYIVFNPNQIKLADGTNTTFDGNNPDIRYADGGLIAPNGKPSNLTPEQYRLVRTPEFKAWFGDWENDPANASKVLDSNGEPLVVYHGTYSKFNIFDKDELGMSQGRSPANMYGFYFTENRNVAQSFGKYLKAFFIKIKKPKTIDIKGGDYSQAKSIVNDFVEKISSKYDGAILFNYKDSGGNKPLLSNQYIVPNSTQIKLADGTNTTFDGSNPDIRYEGGGKVKKVKFDIESREGEEDRTTISIKGIGQVVLVETFPEYEFIDDIDEDTLEKLGVEEGDTIGKIEHLHIEDEYKGQGYAKVLMNEAIRLAKKKHLNPIYLNASPMGTKGLGIKDLTKFYESFGFEVFLEQGNNNLMLLNMDNTPKAADGMLVGNSHAEGGIKINTPEGMIEAEGGEVIINKRSMASNEVVVCEGTPKQIASKINELEGGVQFDTGGSCEIVSTGEMVSESNTQPNEYKAEDGLSVSQLNKQMPMKKYTLTSVIDPNISWQADEEEIMEYIHESQDDFDYVPGESITESLGKLGITLTTNVDIQGYEQAARGTVVRSSDPNVRPSPSVSATIFDVGTRMMGNDGNQWEITEDSRGVRRWKKIKYEEGGTMAADGMNVGQKSYEKPIMERMDTIDDSKELWTWFAKPEVSVDFYVEYETQSMESSTNRWDYRTENVYQETEMIDVPVVSGYEYIGVTDDSGEVVDVPKDMEEELREGLKGMYSKYLEGEEKENLYSGKIKGNHTFENGGPVNDFTQNVKDSLDALIGYMSTHDQKVRIHGSDYELDSMTPMYIRVTGGRGATYNVVPFFSKRGTGMYENAKYYSLTRGGVNKDFALLSDGRVMDIAEDGMDVAERGMNIRGLEVTGNQRRLQYDLEVLRDELKDEVITMDEYYEKRTELYKKYGIIKEDGGEFNANMGYLIAAEKIKNIAPKSFDAADEKVAKRIKILPYANGGDIKTDFNELENTKLRNVLVSFWNDFSNGYIYDYLSIEKENYILSDIDNVFVIFRDKNRGDFSAIEKEKIDAFLSPYFDSDSKPSFSEFFDSYEIKDNKIIVHIKRGKMYANGGAFSELRESVYASEDGIENFTKSDAEYNLEKYLDDIDIEDIEEDGREWIDDYYQEVYGTAIGSDGSEWSVHYGMISGEFDNFEGYKVVGLSKAGSLAPAYILTKEEILANLDKTIAQNKEMIESTKDESSKKSYHKRIERALKYRDYIERTYKYAKGGGVGLTKAEKWFDRLRNYEREHISKKYKYLNDTTKTFEEWVQKVYDIEKSKYSNGGGVGTKNAYDWLQENSDRILEYYLPGSAYDERFTQGDLQEKGDYVIEKETGGDGAPQAFIDICFGDEYEKNVQQIEENYDSYARFLNKISDGEVLLDVQVLTNDESQTIMFLFTDSGYDSRNRKYADGGDMSYPRTGMKMVVFKKKVNPSVTITVKTYPNGQIVEIDNPMDIRFPFSVGQILNMGHRTWACSNGFMVNDQDPCGEEKIFGIRTKDIPQGHEFRSLYPHKFRK